MISKGLDPDLMACSTLINGLCENAKIEKAMIFLDGMISKGYQLNIVTYNTKDFLCKNGEIDLGLNFLNDMISKGHHPNVLTRFISMLCMKCETEKATDYARELWKYGSV
jgi:pentatricopeptide repeat protein